MSRSETPRGERDRCAAARTHPNEAHPHEARPTERERNVLTLMARGMTDRDIAAELRISPATARKHREHLMRKLDVRKSSQVVALLDAAIDSAMDSIMDDTTEAAVGGEIDQATDVASGRADKAGCAERPCPLSARERDVLALLARGLGDKQIARVLGISDHTARKHRANILKRTGARNTCALLHRAMRGGWLDAERILPSAAETVPETAS